jgi:hypothetical protein
MEELLQKWESSSNFIGDSNMPLQIIIPKQECFNNKTQEFFTFPETKISIEHSLISISRWETKYHKPFLEKMTKKTPEEIIDYIKFMSISKPITDEMISLMTKKDFAEIQEYMSNPSTATTFPNDEKNHNTTGEYISSELIYYWMTVYQIPFECEKWHINRLLTLIKICNRKNQPAKKMNGRELRNKFRATNKARRAKR